MRAVTKGSVPVDVVKRRLRSIVPMRGIERRMALSALFVMAFGAVWSILARDWQWFERSGSLLILLAVGFVWLDHVAAAGRVERL